MRTTATRHAAFAKARGSRAVIHRAVGVRLIWRSGRVDRCYVSTMCGKTMTQARLYSRTSGRLCGGCWPCGSRPDAD